MNFEKVGIDKANLIKRVSRIRFFDSLFLVSFYTMFHEKRKDHEKIGLGVE
jgi:hypothetical protein